MNFRGGGNIWLLILIFIVIFAILTAAAVLWRSRNTGWADANLNISIFYLIIILILVVATFCSARDGRNEGVASGLGIVAVITLVFLWILYASDTWRKEVEERHSRRVSDEEIEEARRDIASLQGRKWCESDGPLITQLE